MPAKLPLYTAAMKPSLLCVCQFIVTKALCVVPSSGSPQLSQQAFLPHLFWHLLGPLRRCSWREGEPYHCLLDYAHLACKAGACQPGGHHSTATMWWEGVAHLRPAVLCWAPGRPLVWALLQRAALGGVERGRPVCQSSPPVKVQCKASHTLQSHACVRVWCARKLR